MFDRIFVVEPTRVAGVGIKELIEKTDLPPTLLERTRGDQLRAAIAELPMGGFGVVGMTGTGKSAAIRHIGLEVFGELRVGIVDAEHKAEPNCNVMVMTPGAALNWAKWGKITADDLVVIDEAHQVSDDLEMFMALVKRAECAVVWISATVDPKVYQEYFGSRQVIGCEAYDPALRAEVSFCVVDRESDLLAGLYDEMYMRVPDIIARERGGVIFVPTRKMAEQIAGHLRKTTTGLHVDYYHGGLSAAQMRPYVTGKVPKPFVLVMTPVGATALNVQGLADIIIVDQHFTTVIDNGRKQLERRGYDNNMFLQAGGRVNGRVPDARISIVTDRGEFNFHALRPKAPDFVLGGSIERLALLAAHIGVDALQLSFIGEFDHGMYKRIFADFVERGLITVTNGTIRLTKYGAQVERLPVAPAWGEVLVTATTKGGNQALAQVAMLVACLPTVYDLTTDRWSKTDPNSVTTSDHLTLYNIVAEVLRETARIKNGHYSLDKGKLRELCAERGYAEKQIGIAVQLFQTLCQALGQDLPAPESFAYVAQGGQMYKMFIELIAATGSLDFVYQPHVFTPDVFGSNRGFTRGVRTIGTIRYWTDKQDVPRRSVEGTDVDSDLEGLLKRYGKEQVVRLSDVHGDNATVDTRLTFMGTDIGRDRRKVTVPTSKVPQRLLSEFRKEQAYAIWDDRPQLALPDLSDPAATFPDIVTVQFGTDPVTGEPWLAYGTIIYRLPTWNENIGTFVPIWNLDAEFIRSLHKSAVGRLPGIREYFEQNPEELAFAKARAEGAPLLARIEQLVRDNASDLPFELRRDVSLHRDPPHYLRRNWLLSLENLANRIDMALAASRTLRQLIADELAALQPAALALRDKAQQLLDDNQGNLTDERTAELKALVGEHGSCYNQATLEEWMRKAEDTVKQTEATLNGDLSALLQRFGGNNKRRR
ncbi:MAG TPA: DEAD/DEAH box helicase [Candidatus Saccharimonas sp.]|nr:DEAD/DEAH box helicase [Candidatus Saccharimonas sp.]